MIDKLEFPFTGPQVILSSDRILLHSKKDAIILAGKRAVSLCSTETINLDAKEKIILDHKLNELFLNFDVAISLFDKILFTRLIKTVLIISSYVIGKNIKFDKSILLKKIKKIMDNDHFFLKKIQLIVHPNNKEIVKKIIENSVIVELGHEARALGESLVLGNSLVLQLTLFSAALQEIGRNLGRVGENKENIARSITVIKNQGLELQAAATQLENSLQTVLSQNTFTR